MDDNMMDVRVACRARESSRAIIFFLFPFKLLPFRLSNYYVF